MSTTWVVVADSSRARIFTAKTSTSPLEELETLIYQVRIRVVMGQVVMLIRMKWHQRSRKLLILPSEFQVI